MKIIFFLAILLHHLLRVKTSYICKNINYVFPGSFQHFRWRFTVLIVVFNFSFYVHSFIKLWHHLLELKADNFKSGSSIHRANILLSLFLSMDSFLLMSSWLRVSLTVSQSFHICQPSSIYHRVMNNCTHYTSYAN